MSTGGAFYDLKYRPLQLLPLDRDKVGTNFWLFTRGNHQAEQILVADNNSTITNSMFDPARETKVIIHGFIDNGRLPWVMVRISHTVFTHAILAFVGKGGVIHLN
jgi:pancreatic triacylglycerol lipase